jgi:hypothetical protein
MALDLLSIGSYLRYKKDTAIFMTWLSQAAQACGYTTTSRQKEPSSVTEDRYTIPVREPLVQANAIIDTASPFI